MPSVTGTLSGAGDSAALIDVDATTYVIVLGYQIMAKNSDITVTVKTGSTVQATILCPAGGVGGVSCPPGREPYFIGAAGDDLKINLSGAGSVAYNIQYTTRP